jgi:hypothetical protein
MTLLYINCLSSVFYCLKILATVCCDIDKESNHKGLSFDILFANTDITVITQGYEMYSVLPQFILQSQLLKFSASITIYGCDSNHYLQFIFSEVEWSV